MTTLSAQNANAYLRTKVLSATPEELRLMLLDGAIKFARQGRDGLARRDYEATFNGISQSRSIVLELMTSIRADTDPALADTVRALYGFMYKHLLEASFEKDLAKVDEVIELLEYERETWVMLMDQLARARATPGTTASGSVSVNAQG